MKKNPKNIPLKQFLLDTKFTATSSTEEVIFFLHTFCVFKVSVMVAVADVKESTLCLGTEHSSMVGTRAQSRTDITCPHPK